MFKIRGIFLVVDDGYNETDIYKILFVADEIGLM